MKVIQKTVSVYCASDGTEFFDYSACGLYEEAKSYGLRVFMDNGEELNMYDQGFENACESGDFVFITDAKRASKVMKKKVRIGELYRIIHDTAVDEPGFSFQRTDTGSEIVRVNSEIVDCSNILWNLRMRRDFLDRVDDVFRERLNLGSSV